MIQNVWKKHTLMYISKKVLYAVSPVQCVMLLSLRQDRELESKSTYLSAKIRGALNIAHIKLNLL